MNYHIVLTKTDEVDPCVVITLPNLKAARREKQSLLKDRAIRERYCRPMKIFKQTNSPFPNAGTPDEN